MSEQINQRDSYYQEMTAIPRRQHGAPADLLDYHWIGANANTEALEGGLESIPLDRIVTWRGLPVRMGWSDREGIVGFAFDSATGRDGLSGIGLQGSGG